MSSSVQQQIVISGVGGQGVLFVTRLLAEAAIDKGLPVFTSETHGMAQRGGTVLSHLKIGTFASPLIRPGQADGLLALKAENVLQHRSFLDRTGWIVVNQRNRPDLSEGHPLHAVDADELAGQIDDARAVNLILLGYALAAASSGTDNEKPLFCRLADIRAVLERRLAGKRDLLGGAIRALETGYGASEC